MGDQDWEDRSGCMTFPDAVAKAMKAKGQDATQWLKDSRKMSLDQMRKAAASAGFPDIHFDWEAARSVEGYYRIKGSTEFCIEPSHGLHMPMRSGWNQASPS